MRDQITMKDALAGFEEVTNLDVTNENTKHAVEIIWADKEGDTKRVAELVKAGYKKERWL
jgi:hypothetical protein